MKTKISGLGILVLAFVSLAACSFQDQGLAPLIPQEAIGFVQVSDPDTFLKNADAFMEPMGLTAMTNNMGARDLLTFGLKSTADLDLGDLDLKKPLGLAMMPPTDGSDDFGYIMYLPLVKPEESGPKLLKLLNTMGNVVFSTANGYGIFSQTVSTVSFPPAKSLKLPPSLVFVPGTVTVYGDIQSILSHFKEDWSKLRAEALSEFESLESGMDTSNPMSGSSAAMSKSMVDGMFDAIEQTQSMALHFTVDAKGITVQDTFEFSKDGSIAKIFKAIGPGQAVTSQAKYLPANYLMTGAYSGDPAALKDLYQGWMAVYYDALKLAEADRAVFSKLMDDSFKLSGKNLAWGMDLSLDKDLMSMEMEQILSNLDQAVNFDLVIVQELTDPAGYQKFIKENLSGGVLKKYLDASMAETGFTMDMTLEDKQDGDFTYQEIKFQILVGDPEKLAMSTAESRTAASAMASLMEKLAMVTAVKGSKLYMIMGSGSLDSLKKLVEKDQLELPITGNAVWNTWTKTVPADAQFVGNLSIAGILNIAKVFSGNTFNLEIPGSDQSGINSWVRIKDSSFSSSFSWDIKEMIPVVKTGIEIGSSMFAKQAFSADDSESDFNYNDEPNTDSEDEYFTEDLGD